MSLTVQILSAASASTESSCWVTHQVETLSLFASNMLIIIFFNASNKKQLLTIKSIAQIHLLLKDTLTPLELGLHPVGKHSTFQWSSVRTSCLCDFCFSSTTVPVSVQLIPVPGGKRGIMRHLHTKITTSIAILGFIF